MKDGPITAEVCKRLGAKETEFPGIWHFAHVLNKPLVSWWKGKPHVDAAPGAKAMQQVNTEERLRHFLKAFGFEIPDQGTATTHEFSAGLCVHCGLPPRHASPGGICQVNKYAAPAKRALAAISLEYVGFEPRGMYATYQSPLSVGFCERMFWPQIEAILILIEGKA